MKRAAFLLLAAALAGCAPGEFPPGTGWSRASDLSVYAAMVQFAGIAREQEVLCEGFNTESVDRRWRHDFGARDEAVTAALIARHGEEAVSAAEAASAPTRRVLCEEVPTGYWHDHYGRMLRLLETRLGSR